MGRRSNPTNALRYEYRIKRAPPLEEDLEAPEESSTALGFLDFTILNHGLDLEMAFDPGYRVNDDLCHSSPLLLIPNAGTGYEVVETQSQSRKANDGIAKRFQ